MCQCQYIGCNKLNTLVGEVDSQGGAGVYGNFLLKFDLNQKL